MTTRIVTRKRGKRYWWPYHLKSWSSSASVSSHDRNVVVVRQTSRWKNEHMNKAAQSGRLQIWKFQCVVDCMSIVVSLKAKPINILILRPVLPSKTIWSRKGEAVSFIEFWLILILIGTLMAVVCKAAGQELLNSTQEHFKIILLYRCSESCTVALPLNPDSWVLLLLHCTALHCTCTFYPQSWKSLCMRLRIEPNFPPPQYVRRYNSWNMGMPW